MAQVKLVCVSAFLLLILFQNILFSEGRKLKNHKISENLKTISSINEPVLNSPMLPPPSAQTTYEPLPPSSAHADGFRPTAPGHSPGIGHSLKNLKTTFTSESKLTVPLSPPPSTQTIDEPRTPSPAHADGFRPTAPGNSPGIGHSLQNRKTISSSSTTLPSPAQEVDEQGSPYPGQADGFRPTAPGHSPGIGHSIQN